MALGKPSSKQIHTVKDLYNYSKDNMKERTTVLIQKEKLEKRSSTESGKKLTLLENCIDNLKSWASTGDQRILELPDRFSDL